MTSFTKTPNQTLDYSFDWTDYLIAENDTLLSFAFVLIGGGNLVTQTTNGNIGAAWIEGGTDGTTLQLICTITTASGKTDSRTDYIRIRSISLVTEDGTGMPNSESYADVNFADDYHADRGNTKWFALTQDRKEAFLRQATEYLVNTYRMLWQGRRVQVNQALDWPRVGVVLQDFGGSQGRDTFGSYGLFQVDYKSVPLQVKKACAEMAIRAITGSLIGDLKQRILEKTVGPIKVVYDDLSSQNVRYPMVDQLLKVFLINGGNSVCVKLSRT